ncbi:MAG: hypothetical protein JNK05_07185 [Myxococcales bacterium]|nr:hypothetical protein [Myxococcales bacterium]
MLFDSFALRPRSLVVIVASTLVSSCGPTRPAPSFVARCDHRTCAAGESIVARDGSFECVVLGAKSPAATARWPAVGAPLATRRFVDPAAAAGGDGRTEASAFVTIAQAIADGATSIALARGTHAVTTPLSAMAVQLLGAGSGTDGSVLRLDPGTSIQINGASELQSLRIEGGTTAAITTTSGTLSLREVVFDSVESAISARDASIVAREVTVRRARGRAINVAATAAGVASSALDSVLVEDGAGPGIVFEGAGFTAERVSVRRQQRDGFALVGAGFAAQGSLTDSSLACNGVTGLRVQGVGAQLDATRLYVAGTTAPAGTVGGDGVFAHDGARLSFDSAIATPTDADQGRHSMVLDNERAGLLVDGRNAAGAPSSAELRIVGARVEGNGASGLFLQRGARATLVGYSIFERNRALGVGLTTGSEVVEFRCDIFRDARAGTLATTPPVDLGGDGLSAASSTIGLVLMSRFDENGRFAAVFTQSNVRMFVGNRGVNNGLSVGAYASMFVETGSDVRGGTPPSTPPVTARDSITLR